MRGKLLIAGVSLMLVAGCETESADGSVEVFEIAPDTVQCEGVGPQRCLVVNGEFFYDEIAGYTHRDGQAARICVLRIQSDASVPADASLYTYRQVSCS